MADFSWVPKELSGRFSYVDGKLVASCEKCGATRHTSGRGYVLKEIAAGREEKFRMCGSCGNYKGFKPTTQDIASWPEGHKRCGTCKIVKPFEEFHRHSTALYGFNTICRDCRKPTSAAAYRSLSWERTLFDSAKSRAKAKGREFTLELSDIVIPKICPVLGVSIVLERGNPLAPSIDRTDSSKGYTPDNIVVMSTKANTFKNNMTRGEAFLLWKYMSDTQEPVCIQTVYRIQ